MRINAGVFVIDHNNTLDDASDDKSRWLGGFTDQDGNVLSPFNINCVTEDLNGNLWMGTVVGPLVVNNASNVFSSSFNVTRIKIPRNDGTGNADYLLNDIRINCIAVDGANRKWIGTNGNGVYLVSADGLVTVHQFNSKNSPLPSDYIWSITIDPETGEVFFGTDSGLVSYRSDATQSKADFSKVYVFPNPVKPEYSGKITVTGLEENTQVRITDLAGNVMISGTSLGGQFTWDGYSALGKKAASGVYLVLCASQDGLEAQACKFMIVR
jgi:ligand-binding sensor domain-containing protein